MKLVLRSVACSFVVLVALVGCVAEGDPEADAVLRTSSQSALSACSVPAGFTEAEWETLLSHTPLPDVPADTTNAVADDPAARKLGQKLFFDPGFSGPIKVASDLGEVGEVGKVSCASCHSGPMFDDRRSVPRTVSLGVDFHTRNSPALVNSAFYKWTNWGGRFSTQWELPMPVTENGVILNGNRLQVAHRIFDVYRKPYEKVFGPLEPALGDDAARFPAAGKPKAAGALDGPWESMAATDREIVNRIFVNYGKALAAYFRVLTSGDSAFDRFMAGKKHALSLEAQAGARLFVGKARCSGCHSGPLFAGSGFHNLGVPQAGEKVPASDDGRFKDVPPLLASGMNAAGAYSDDPEAGAAKLLGLSNPMPELARGAFRTPSLRGVALSEPYMHSGQLATLEDVITFYDQGGGTPVAGTKSPFLQPLGLTEEEKAQLVAFLDGLTGKGVKEKYTQP
jgi:cytochrome c peroxidase